MPEIIWAREVQHYQVTFIADLRTNMRVCEGVCIGLLPIIIYTFLLTIYHEIHVKNHSSANSHQVPYFLIRSAAKKVTFML